MDPISDDLGATGAVLPPRIGPFTITDRIGRGGMGVVLDARLDGGQRVALKLIRPAGTADDQRVLVARLLREAAAIARLDHPGVVRLVRYGNADGNVYLAMEHVTGVTLKDIQRRTSLDAVTLVSLATQVLTTLAHLHGAGIVHRDIKPDNILITNEGRSVLADFGIAWHPDAVGITRPGEVIGSVGYLAPECIEGGTPTPASDIYALGRTLFEMAALEARPALPRATPILDRFALRMVVDWTRFPSAHPWPSIRMVIERMIAHGLTERFETAEECAAAFRELAKVVRPLTEGGAGQPRDLNDIGDDFTCFEPAATLSAFVDHLDLPKRSFWEDDDNDDEAATLPPGTMRPAPDPDFNVEDTRPDNDPGSDVDAPIEHDLVADDRASTVPTEDRWGAPTPLPQQNERPSTPRLPPARRPKAAMAPTRSPSPVQMSPTRRAWPALVLGLIVGAVLGLGSAWLVERPPAIGRATDQVAAAQTLERAKQRLAERDFGAARVELERCVALANLAACHERLAILLALRGDPAALRH